MFYTNRALKFMRNRWLVVSVIASILLLTVVSYIELDPSPRKWISDSFHIDRFQGEYDLLLMTAVDDNNTDIDLLKNWTSLFSSDRVRLLFLLQGGSIKSWQDYFPEIDIIPVSSEMIMCNKHPVLNLNKAFEMARERYKSHFYGYINQNVLTSNEILATVSDLINDYREIDKKESTLIIARSRLVKDKNVALQLLNTQSNLPSTPFKYTLSDMSDVFITNRQFEWFNIPSLIAHEDSTSQLLMAISRQKRIVLLDVTRSTNLIRTRMDTHRRPSRYNMRCVKNMLIESDIEDQILKTCGKILCVGFETIWENGKTVLKNRPIPGDCSECNNDSTEIGTAWLPN